MKLQLTQPQLANLPQVYQDATNLFIPPKNIYKESYAVFDWDKITLALDGAKNLFLLDDGKVWRIKNPEFFYSSNIRHLKSSMGFRIGIRFLVHRQMEGDNCVLECVAKLWFTERSRAYFSQQSNRK